MSLIKLMIPIVTAAAAGFATKEIVLFSIKDKDLAKKLQWPLAIAAALGVFLTIADIAEKYCKWAIFKDYCEGIILNSQNDLFKVDVNYSMTRKEIIDETDFKFGVVWSNNGPINGIKSVNIKLLQLDKEEYGENGLSAREIIKKLEVNGCRVGNIKELISLNKKYPKLSEDRLFVPLGTNITDPNNLELIFIKSYYALNYASKMAYETFSVSEKKILYKSSVYFLVVCN